MKCEQTLERIVCIHKIMPLPVVLLFIFAAPPKRHGIAMGGGQPPLHPCNRAQGGHQLRFAAKPAAAIAWRLRQRGDLGGNGGHGVGRVAAEKVHIYGGGFGQRCGQIGGLGQPQPHITAAVRVHFGQHGANGGQGA